MDEIIKKVKCKELLVRKKLARFLEKIFNFLNYDFSHDEFKSVVYNEKNCETKLEKMIKNYYDGMIYLYNNSSNDLTLDILKKFFNIIEYKNFNLSNNMNILIKYIHIKNNVLLEKIIDFHLYLYNSLNGSETEKTLISLIFLNLLLLKSNIPCICILLPELKKYKEARDNYFKNKKNDMYKFMLEILRNSKYQSKNYYKNIVELNTEDIIKVFYNDKYKIQNIYKIKHLILFGSFAKRNSRFDSDIDLMCIFDEYVPYSEKIILLEQFKKEYYLIFNRFVDVCEITNYINENIIKELKKYEKIF